MNVGQFRGFVVRPALTHLGLWSQPAENLLVGTALHESGGLQFIDQDDDFKWRPSDRLGPAIGFYQIEEATLNDLFANFLDYRPLWRARLLEFAAPVPSRALQLASNLGFATAVARLIYWRAPDPLPAAEDIYGLADYWKRHFNTHAGKGDPDDWARAYRRHHRET
jgi:hypothetical protein